MHMRALLHQLDENNLSDTCQKPTVPDACLYVWFRAEEVEHPNCA